MIQMECEEVSYDAFHLVSQTATIISELTMKMSGIENR